MPARVARVGVKRTPGLLIAAAVAPFMPYALLGRTVEAAAERYMTHGDVGRLEAEVWSALTSHETQHNGPDTAC